jgi:hypothetical protein
MTNISASHALAESPPKSWWLHGPNLKTPFKMTDPLFYQDLEKERKSKIFGTPEFRQAYQHHINSSAWKKLCKEVRSRAHYMCERCGGFSVRLEIHHISYERFRNELLTDLQALCKRCHEVADRERIAANQQKFEEAGEQARYENARDTYMTKKYGENWYGHCGQIEYEEFDDWLENKRDQEW